MTHYFIFGVLYFFTLTASLTCILEPKDYWFPDFMKAILMLTATICQAVEIWGK